MLRITTLKNVIAFVVIAIALFLFYLLAHKAVRVPLLDGHAMKSVCIIESAANIVKYRNCKIFYLDYYATVDDPSGKRTSLLRHETPLNVLALAGIYAVGKVKKLDKQVRIARYYSWWHCILAYLLLALIFYRRDPIGLLFFSSFYLFSYFTIYYSTRPMAEIFALFYQALYIAVVVYLLRRDIDPTVKAGALMIFSLLLCFGGKMNYFLIAAPVVAFYPFADNYLRSGWRKLRYYAMLTVCLLLAVGWLCVIKYDVLSSLKFFIIGNKALLHGSYWLTYWEGFLSFPMIFERTMKDFGPVVFWGGLSGLLWAAAKWLRSKFLLAKPPSRQDSLQRAIVLLAAGHALNYIVLRNLYIPHEYYLIPTFTIFLLAFLSLLGDCRSWLASVDFMLPGWLKRLPAVGYFRIDSRRANYISRILKWAILLTTLFGSALVILGAIVAIRLVQESIIFIVQSLEGSIMVAQHWPAYLADTSMALLLAGGLLLALTLIFVLFNIGHDIFLHCQSGLATRANRLRFCQCLGLVTLVLLFIVLAVGDHNKFRKYYKIRKFYNGCLEALAQLRLATRPEELILCPDAALPFYAQRRSIICPTNSDMPKYRQAGIRYYLAHTWQKPKQSMLQYLELVEFKTPVPILIYRIKPELPEKQ